MDIENKKNTKNEEIVGNQEKNEDNNKYNMPNKVRNVAILLRFVEFLIIVTYLVCSYFYINNIPILSTSYFNNMILSSFNENDNCLNYFNEIMTVSDVNKWILYCFSDTLTNHLVSSSDSSLSFKIFSAQIQQCDYVIQNCKNDPDSTGFMNITNNGSICRTGTRSKVNIRKPDNYWSFGVLTNENWNNTLPSILDYLFFDSVNLYQASIIDITDQKMVTNIKNLLTSSYIIKAKKYNQDISYLIPDSNQRNLTNIIIQIGAKSANVSGVTYDIFDPNTNQMNLIVYFVSDSKNNNSTDYLGMIVFILEQDNDGFITRNVNNYSIKINDYSKGVFTIFEIISLLSIFTLFITFYLKYEYLKNVEETLYRSIFFLVFFVFLIFEYLYKVNLILKKTFNYESLDDLIQQPNIDLAIFSIENLKILKSFGIIFLCYHMI